MPIPSKPGSPRWKDQRQRVAGEYARRTGSTHAQARELGLTERRIRQLNAGDPPGLPQWVVDYLDRLIDGSGTNPWPIPASMIEHITRRDSAYLYEEELLERVVGVLERPDFAHALTRILQVVLRGRARREDLVALLQDAPGVAIGLLELSAYARALEPVE
jgi:hypothetical protein